MKVFISIPMNGRSDEDVCQDIQAIKTTLLKDAPDLEFLDTYIKDQPPLGVGAENNGLWYLGRSLEILAQSDLAVFAKGWEEARGCWMEHEACVKYGIPRKYMEEI